MNTRQKLDKEFSSLDKEGPEGGMERYIAIADGYAAAEGALAVLSNLRSGMSHIAFGAFSALLDIDRSRCGATIGSIWEQEIFKAVHPADLEMKMTQELLFYHHINRLPPGLRFRQCLIQRLRMRTREGEYVDALHRLSYIPARDGSTVWLALCVYGAMTVEPVAQSYAADTVTGHTTVLDRSACAGLLTRQETAVIRLIDSGRSSREIGAALNISVNTVSRHRQNILAKLQAANSAEACSMARRLALL